MEQYCGSTLWDIDIFWKSKNPDLTTCFEQTILLWPACGFLWITGIFQILCSSKRKWGFHGNHSWTPVWTWLSLLKVFNVILLSLLQMVLLTFHIYLDQRNNSNTSSDSPVVVAHVSLITPLILIATLALSGLLIVIHKARRIHTSSIQLIYWILMAFITGLNFRSNLLSDQTQPSLIVLIIQGATTFISFLQSFLFCWSDIPSEIKTSDNECPMLRSSCLSFILFYWCTPLVRRAAKITLTPADLWAIIPSLRCSQVFPRFYTHFSRPPPITKKTKNTFQNFLGPLVKTCGKDFALAHLCKLTSGLLAFLSPKLMGFLIDFVNHPEIELWKGYLWAVLLLLVYLLSTLLVEQFYLYMYKCHMNLFACLNLAIYQKSMRLSSEARKKSTTGEIVNLMIVDVKHIGDMLYETHAVTSGLVPIFICLYFLWEELGPAFLSVFVVFICIIPVNMLLTSWESSYQHVQMAEKDNRIKVTSEVLGAIQAVKMYAWEPSFIKQITDIRRKEVKLQRNLGFCKSGTEFVLDSVPFLVSVASFLTYVYWYGGVLDAKKAFTAVAYFNLLSEPITEFPSSISEFIGARVSFQRLNSFLNAEEIQQDAIGRFPKSNSEKANAVEIANGTFKWEKQWAYWTLENINLTVKEGSLTAIVGNVASGKSSLLSAILGDIRKVTGQVTVWGKVAYAPQTAWIFNGTLRENILFGLPFEQDKFKQVLECCCLVPDIEMMPAGDLTEIGEKGINLSGGQKQRVSLARAVYSEADVLLLDDVLSAVDSHVGKEIFNRLLGPSGLLKEKTRILCTHAYQFLSQVDQIVMLEQGKIVDTGAFEELKERSAKFTGLMSKQGQSETDSTIMENEQKSEAKLNEPSLKPTTSQEKAQLIEEETVETGNIKLSTYHKYVQAMSCPLAIFCIVLLFISELLSFRRHLVLKDWTSSPVNMTTYYSLEYSLTGIGQCICSLLGFTFLTISTLQASQQLHNNMLQRILHAPLHFFHVTPLGRLTNRFSGDMENIDSGIRLRLGDWIIHVFNLIFVFIAVIFASNIYLLIYILALIIAYYILQRYSIQSMQQLERLCSQTKSLIYAQFQESLAGTSTLRAYKAQERYMNIMGDKIDQYHCVGFPNLVVRRWLSIYLGLLGSTVVFIAAMSAVWWRGSSDPGMVGLGLTYAMQLTMVLSWLVKVTSYLQCNFVSVERALEYCKVEQEASFEKGKRECPKNWPERGEITFTKYGARYRPGLELVLEEFECKIGAGEKIGIVGRTGAGKSSLTLGLFRILEAGKGKIWIDGVNIAELGLHQLRKRLTVIPQDPVLFSRSLRLNLDPFGEYEDNRIWEALEMAQLKQFVEGQGQGLEFQVAEGGENLSLGQKNLICLARAILRKSKILVLDEATASVDVGTDELIQKTIREQFKDCTILNVAHRLDTVRDSSRILVLDKGKVVEFDTPDRLLANPNSFFYGLARHAGIT